MADYKPRDPLVREAKRLAEQQGVDGCLILFTEDRTPTSCRILGGASYGHTKAFCQRMGRLLDHICSQGSGKP